MKALIYEQFNPLIDIYTRLLTERGFEVFATKSLDHCYQLSRVGTFHNRCHFIL